MSLHPFTVLKHAKLVFLSLSVNFRDLKCAIVTTDHEATETDTKGFKTRLKRFV
jgi:hypothetical protein